MPHFPLSLHLVAVGRMKDANLAAACKNYLDRLRRYLEVEVKESRDSIGKGRRDDEAMEQEGRALRRLLRPGAWVLSLTIDGDSFSSEQFAALLQQYQEEGRRELDFVIGGPLGLSAEVIECSHLRLSLSPMTFSHELARLILLEQLYRACTILKGEKYHK